MHAVIEALGVGPVRCSLAVAAPYRARARGRLPRRPDHPVAHEPVLIPVLPNAPAAERARAGVRDVYEASGSNAGMAAFIAMTSWRGEFTDDYFSQPRPDPAQFGMPTDDDGSRDDPLLSDRSWAITSYRPDVDALAAASTRIVIAVGEESLDTFSGRTAVATAELLGQQAAVFPVTTVGSSVVSPATPANPRLSPGRFATSSTTTAESGSAHGTIDGEIGGRTSRSERRAREDAQSPSARRPTLRQFRYGQVKFPVSALGDAFPDS